MGTVRVQACGGEVRRALLRVAGRGCAALVWLLSACAAPGQPVEPTAVEDAPRITYEVRLPAPHTQTIDITMRIAGVSGERVDVALPVWRPGRYEVLEFAGSVRRLTARSAAGAALPVRKVDKSTWRVETGGADEVRVDYEIYANSLGDRTRHVDDTHAFLSGSSVFLYVPQRRAEPVSVRIDVPQGWRVATGLEADRGQPGVFHAPSYDVLIDCPIEAGVHEWHAFDVDGAAHELVLWGRAAYDAERVTADLASLVAEQRRFWDGAPYERYLFIVHAADGIGGGTEHLNSTVMQVSPRAFETPERYRGFLTLASHEFFHTWNVKALRPAGLNPYDFSRENYTDLLWVAEGATSYYADVLLVRAGLLKPKEFHKRLAERIGDYRDRPGRQVQSVAEASFDAWIKFNRPTPDSVNTTVSFYSEGALATMLLDLELRRRTDNGVSFDDVLRDLYRRFPLSGPGYTSSELIESVERLSGQEFDGFFADYVFGTKEMEFETALATAGLELHFEPAKDEWADEADEADEQEDEDQSVAGEGQEAAEQRADVVTAAPAGVNGEQAAEAEVVGDRNGSEGNEPRSEDEGGEPDRPARQRAYLGVSLAEDELPRVRSVRADGPAYAAGVMAGDLLVAMDGVRLRGNLADRLKAYQPGDVITLSLFRRDELRTLQVTLAGEPDGTWKVRRVAEPTEHQEAVYASWLGQ